MWSHLQEYGGDLIMRAGAASAEASVTHGDRTESIGEGLWYCLASRGYGIEADWMAHRIARLRVFLTLHRRCVMRSLTMDLMFW